MEKLVVLAIGGNSLIKDKEHKKVEDQYAAICETAKHIASIIESGYDVIVTHGNGPQVGFMMRRSEIAVEVEHMHPVPLVNCDADTQGAIGYQIQQALQNEFAKRKMHKKAVTLITQVEVDKNDDAFTNPSKPIGSFYDETEIEKIKQDHPDWQLKSDAGRGYRRIVPSPKPVKIIEKPAIEMLIHNGFAVIAVGGGGIPVIKDEDNNIHGINAVIDKDNASSLLASQLKAELFIISTAVKYVYINFGKADEMALKTITLSELKKYKEDGHFAEGSMLPKVEAVIDYMENGGQKALITSPEYIEEALKGNAGTFIVHDK